MKNVISKELFTAIMGIKFGTYFCGGEETEKRLWVDDTGSTSFVCWDAVPYTSEISFYELAHRAKVWASDKGYRLMSCQDKDAGYCEVMKAVNYPPVLHSETYDTEQEAIFKACQWVLEKGD